MDPAALEELFSLLDKLLTEERFAYDYTGEWRFICARPEEYRRLCELRGLNTPTKTRLKCKDKIPEKEGVLRRELPIPPSKVPTKGPV